MGHAQPPLKRQATTQALLLALLGLLCWQLLRGGGGTGTGGSGGGAAPVTIAAAPPAAGGSASGLPCDYGSLPGTYVSSAPEGERWQPLLPPPGCELRNLVARYVGASQAAAAAAAGRGAPPAPLPHLRVLLLSDSVGRYSVYHLCHRLSNHSFDALVPLRGGEVRSMTNQHMHQQALAEEARMDEGHSPPDPPYSFFNQTATALHLCNLSAVPLPLSYANSHLPGVHPSGPYFQLVRETGAQRVDTARRLWSQFAGEGAEPHVVGVAAALWDLARMYELEPAAVAGEELGRGLVEQWAANFTELVRRAQRAFPKTRVWVTHSTVPPRHDQDGRPKVPYAGRRNHVDQLSAAAEAVARRMGLFFVDYAAMARRYQEGQANLADNLHPHPLVSVEASNVLLNLAWHEACREGGDGGSACAAGR